MVAQQASLTLAHSRSSEKAFLIFAGWTTAYVSQPRPAGYPVSRLFAQAVNALLAQQRLQPRDIVAIGCRGQTVWHEPTGEAPHTLQIGDNNHYRRPYGDYSGRRFSAAGYCAGGQARRWCPLSITRCWDIRRKKCMVLNIGGIANLSLAFPRTGGARYDTGRVIC